MVKQQNHFKFSAGVALSYAGAGIFVFDIYPEHVLLASVIVVLAGMLPDIDAGSGSPLKELGGLLAAVSPLVVLQYFPTLNNGDVGRLALVVICCYLLTRVLVVRGIQKFTQHRGMIHSVPAAILTFEATYLLFWDLLWVDRLYIAFAAFVGFLSHLLLDAYGNLNLVGRALGKAEKKPAVLKFFGNSWPSTVLVYSGVFALGFLIAEDFYPHLLR